MIGIRLPEMPPGARHMTLKAAAKKLGVSIAAIEIAISQKKLKAYRDVGRTGQPVVLVDTADLLALRDRFGLA